ncbi:MAG: hypothetical protein IT430_17465 [Phycisphaerales bacterium]|nr:hypothetical protein [Phycisphaerales bacterium]
MPASPEGAMPATLPQPVRPALTSPPPEQERPIECPRCGYDLRGAVQSWREACPLQGVCAECGLEFEWSRVHSNATHPWLIEYHWRRRPISSLLRTLAAICGPKRFWSAVDLTDPVHFRPTVSLALLMLALPLIFRWIGASTFLLAQTRLTGSWRPWWASRPATATDIMVAALDCSFWVLSPDDTATYYSSDVPWLVVVPQVVLWWFGLAWPLLTALCFVLIPISLRRIRVRPEHIRRIGAYGIVWMMLPLVALAAVEMAALIINAASIWATGREAYGWWNVWLVPLTAGMLPTLPFFFAPFAYWWWAAACRCYLRLPDSRMVAALLTLLSGLITLGGFVFIAETLGAHGWWIEKL